MEQEILYVKNYLAESGGDVSEKPEQRFRSRFEHTLRVLGWVRTLCEGLEADREALELAAVFHDVGYERADNEKHAARSADIFLAYARAHGMPKAMTEKVYELVLHHSEKALVTDETPLELLLLMDADLLDEEGALAIIWDCLAVAAQPGVGYRDAYERILRFESGTGCPVKTERAKRIWREKRELVERFLFQLRQDLFLP